MVQYSIERYIVLRLCYVTLRNGRIRYLIVLHRKGLMNYQTVWYVI